MTKREKEIFELIRKNSSISQKEIAKKLNLTRTSVAVHISHIVEKGYITGRKYIIRENPQVLVIGACNMDMQGFANKNFDLYNSNIGSINISHGGVGRNIALNINKLIKDTKLITVLSSDKYGFEILNDLSLRGIDLKDVLISDNKMSKYLSIFDTNNEMIAAISDMSLINELNLDYLTKRKSTIEKASYVVIDTNIPEESIEYISKNISSNAKLFVDTVSIEKAVKIKKILNRINVLKTNKLELESIMGKALNKISDIKLACQHLLNEGVEKVFVTLGSNGLVYGDKTKIKKISNPEVVDIVDVNGAGDIFTSALVYSYYKRLCIDNMARLAQSASIYKLGVKGTTPDDFCIERIKEVARKYKLNITRGGLDEL